MSFDGLLVTVTPSQSAFFAGELFLATVTFSNPAPKQPAPPARAASHQFGPPVPVRTSGAPHGAQSAPARGPAHGGFGYGQDVQDQLPRGGGVVGPGLNDGVSESQVGGPRAGPSHSHPAPPAESTYHRGQPATPTSTTSHNPHLLNQPGSASGPLLRSVSGLATAPSTPSTSKAKLPTRKGLIGQPLVPPASLASPSRAPGIYNGVPRRPGGARAHSRSQSMAVSSPDLLPTGAPDPPTGAGAEGQAAPAGGRKAHGRSRLGGSMAVDMSGVDLGPRRAPGGGPLPNGRNQPPPAIVEEPDSAEGSPELSQLANGHFAPPTSEAGSSSYPANHPYSQHHGAGQQHQFDSSASLARSDSDEDPADSSQHLPGRGFYSQGQNDTMDSVVHAGIDEWKRGRNMSSSSLGQFPAPVSRQSSAATATPRGPATSAGTALHPPNTLGVLWSFAHLEGTFEVDDQLINPAEFLEVKRALLGGAAGMGGGTLGERRGRSGWREWIWGAQASKGGKGATLEERKERGLKEKSVPTFASPPSILGVDLVLEPGESKSYSFAIRIPADMPPSFRGKSIRFLYNLVVGTNRSTVGGASFGPSARGASSRVMRVPIRVYNHVAVTGARPFYDLTNPIIYHRDEATVSLADEDGHTRKKEQRVPQRPDTGRADFEAYASALLASVTPLSPTLPRHRVPLSPSLNKSPTLLEAPAHRPEMSSRTQGDHSLGLDDKVQGELDDPDGGEGIGGCKSAVEIVSRNSQKVSYDINKDGYMVARVTLVKSSYRLGETVNGSVVVNGGEGRVIRFSARLETHELIETTVSTMTALEVRASTRRLHAEHHETTLDAGRVGFALAIPSGATPDFATSGVKLQWSVRLTFLVVPPSPDAPPPPASLGGPRRLPLGMPGGPPSPGPGGSPSGAAAGRHGRSKSFAYGFEPAVPLTLPAAPLTAQSGATHLMPTLGPRDASPAHTAYRAVPDLGFVPVLFSGKEAPPAPPSPGPLQRTAGGAAHTHRRAESSAVQAAAKAVKASVVLVPAKVDTVECNVPVKVYPGNTPFRPVVTVFEA